MFVTIENTQSQSQAHDPFAYLYPYEFIRLITLRKNGVAVPTAMWFAHDQGKLYMVTSATAGKIKRIRNNGRVLLAPCDVGGKVLGEQIEAYAHELPPDQHEYANTLLATRYGEQYEMSALEESTADYEDDETFIEIEPITGVTNHDSQ
jgi:PPOX class probable F420-dependent enzyme